MSNPAQDDSTNGAIEPIARLPMNVPMGSVMNARPINCADWTKPPAFSTLIFSTAIAGAGAAMPAVRAPARAIEAIFLRMMFSSKVSWAMLCRERYQRLCASSLEKVHTHIILGRYFGAENYYAAARAPGDAVSVDLKTIRTVGGDRQKKCQAAVH